MIKRIIKCTQYDLMKANAKNGQIYFVTDSRSLYKDNGNDKSQRLRFNAVILHTESERLNSIKPTIGKFYYVEETNSLWLFDTRWVLKVADNTSYNSYYAGNYISPVINTDPYVSGTTGDKIIDNNGLLGNGAVVIRDSDRIIRGVNKSNNTYNRLELTSYLDDGFLFIPNGHLPYNDLSTSLGALHLTVEKKEINNMTNLTLNGSAHYYGTWNNYGDMYLIQKKSQNMITPDIIPINDYELIKFYITCKKETSEGVVTRHIVLRPISDKLAIFHMIAVLNENTQSVVQNDMGELIYTNGGDVLENTIYESNRHIHTTNDSLEYKCTYALSMHGDNIIISQNKNSTDYLVTLPEEWYDNKDSISIYANRWIKDKVLTYNDLMEILKTYKS